MSDANNVLGQPLQLCGLDPVTGFFRDGCCQTGPQDRGTHVVCAQVTAEFLSFTKSQGNDLSTPMPLYGFPGLQPGDRWCLCVSRWQQAFIAGFAPPIILAATHEATLTVVPLPVLQEYAIDLID